MPYRSPASLVLFVMPACIAHAGEEVAGVYRCAAYNVGGSGGYCRLASPLNLKEDGSYHLGAERGSYSVNGGRVHLSESKIRGPGKFLGDNAIVFEYQYKGLAHTLTYRCFDCGKTETKRTPRSLKQIDVDLTLEFPEDDGFLDWANVILLEPYGSDGEQEADKGGAVQGLTYRSGARSVKAYVKGIGVGRIYRVSLSSGRQTLPVADLDLSDISDDASLTVAAQLIVEDSSDNESYNTPEAWAEEPALSPSLVSESSPGITPSAVEESSRDAPVCNPLIQRYNQPGCREAGSARPSQDAPMCNPLIPHYSQPACREATP